MIGHPLFPFLPSILTPRLRSGDPGTAGSLVGRIVLDDGQRILGFGQRTAYLVTTEQVGLEWLNQHRWPRS